MSKDPVQDVQAEDSDAAKVLFLCTKPVHVPHEETDNSSSCQMCRLLSKYKDSILSKSVRPLKRELKVKTLKMNQFEVSENLEISTLESNFSDTTDELDGQDEELLTFTEVLDLMNIPIPQLLHDKLDIILKEKKIPIAQNSKKADPGQSKKKNCFLSYTLNKKLSEICDKLSIEEVYAMKEFTLSQKEDDQAVIKLIEALSIINDFDEMKLVSGMKEVIFFYIILNMFKESLLNRLYTHTLEFILKGAKSMLPDPDKRLHIDDSAKQLKRYPLTASPPGICIILSMTIDREGAENDVRAVKNVFENDFNFDVFVKLNPTQKDIKNLVAKVSASRNMFYDSLVVWFMSHGDKTTLTVKDGEIHRRTELLHPFAEIEWLNKKPKLFFIQACANKKSNRNSLIESGGGMKSSRDSLSFGMPASNYWKQLYSQHTDAVEVNSLADTLVSYATMWYCEASRNINGSLYVHTLLDSLKRFGRETSIENVLREMHYNVNTVQLAGDSVWKQTPYYESSLQKEFILP